MIPITRPFVIWGLDLVGKLSNALGNFNHLFVVIDKFTKWSEAKPITMVTARQFTRSKFVRFCEKLHINVRWASVDHMQTNGQVERANDCILPGLKPQIFDKLNKLGERWVSELKSVLWGQKITPSKATGLTPFFLIYRPDVILPKEVSYASL